VARMVDSIEREWGGLGEIYLVVKYNPIQPRGKGGEQRTPRPIPTFMAKRFSKRAQVAGELRQARKNSTSGQGRLVGFASI